MNYEEALKIANNKHDVIGLQIYDKREAELPAVGMMKARDAETGEVTWVDTSSKNVRQAYHKWWHSVNHTMKTTFSQSGVDFVRVATDEDYVKPLVNLFKRR